MEPIQPKPNWRSGAYTIVASSAQAKAEWDSFVAKVPTAMKVAYERLSSHPLEVSGTRQFPLKGTKLKPFWEYEITGGDRLYYAVDRQKQVVVVCVLPHATKSRSMTKTVESRSGSFKTLVEDQQRAKESEAAEKRKV